MAVSFPLHKVHDELRDLGSLDDDKAGWVLDSFFSDGQGDFDNKLGYPFEEDGHQGQLRQDGGSFEASDFWFLEDPQVFFSGAISSFGSWSEGAEFLVAWGAPDDFCDQAGMLFDGHMFNGAVVVDEARAVFGELSDFFILGLDALSLAGKGCSLRIGVEAVWSA